MRSSSRAVVAEADDHSVARRHAAHAPRAGRGRPCCRAASRSRRRSAVAGEELGETFGVALVGQPLAGVRRGSARRGAPPRAGRRALRRAAAGRRTRRCRRRAAPRARGRRGRRPPEHLADVGRADEDGLGRPRAPRAPRAASSALPRIEYSSSEPWALTAEARARSRRRPDRRAARGSRRRGRRAAARGAPPRSRSTHSSRSARRAVLDELHLVALRSGRGRRPAAGRRHPAARPRAPPRS